MTLVRFDPAREVDALQGDMNRLFNSFFGRTNGNGNGHARRWIPAVDLLETEDALVLRADLPGMKEDDIELEVKDGVLTLSGERKAEHEEHGEGYHRVERSFGSFSRSLTMPRGVDAGAVKADFSDGVLEVRIPKPEEAKPTRIQIGAGGAVEGSGTEK